MTFEFYRRVTIRGRRWFWRARARNGRIIAIGGEGYVNLRDAQSTVFLIQREAPVANSEGGER
jgi:uncharacterized protein YegP (UPF0339 family)